ncbi:acetylglutamate kinase [Mangrovimonas xylaniphaga]|uniref:acetylglutamate kinase n=1 Tax=Mangrovimonas xylaniphaga TaxID=1645915 RepID=UPI0006B560AA|nr:acetylglutamate kinase [Mangrovimonas xylaniphaga]
MKTLKIVKIGGNIIDDSKALDTFLEQFSVMESPKLLVHGGGKLASQLAQKMEVEVKMVQGRRITDAETLDIITMVYGGKINKNIVAKLQALQCNAIGFTGADGNTIVSVKRPVKDIDYGFVGDVEIVNTEILELLMGQDIASIFCAITHDAKGNLLNTNADTIASELAIGFAEKYNVELYYCFEKNGVLRDVNDEDSVIETITEPIYQNLLSEGIIADGMLPKLNNCFHAINKNVTKVCIGKPNMLTQPTTKFTTITK